MGLSFDVFFRYIAIMLLIIGAANFFLFQYSIDPYMDEIFHIPQAQHYCQGDFAYWDPKITTFPGLYYVSYAFYRVLEIIKPITCTPDVLRAVNVFLSYGLLFLLQQCRTQVAGDASDSWRVAALLFSYPVNFFFYYLYYTDTFSTFSLVLLFLLSSNSRSSGKGTSVLNHAAVLLVAVSCILARQTNAVWILFIIGTNMLQTLMNKERIQSKSTNNARVTGAVSLLRHEDSFTVTQLKHFLSLLWKHKIELVTSTLCLLLPVVGFIVFVVKNGGIVLGDKENHKPVLHWAMLVHMLFIVGLVNAPDTLADLIVWLQTPDKIKGDDSKPPSSPVVGVRKVIRWFLRSLTVRNVLTVSLCVGAVYLSLVHGSYSHPFLLSDNRHYVFYLWKRVLSHHRIRLLLVPVYSVSVLVTLTRLRRSHGSLWVIIFLIAATISLVPTPLLEVRYFTPGVVMATLHCPHKTASRITSLSNVLHLFLLLGFTAVNVVTIYVFLFRPFKWPDNSVARFMY